MNFQCLEGDAGGISEGGKWISKRLRCAQMSFDYYFVVNLINMLMHLGDECKRTPYWVGIDAVSPDVAAKSDDWVRDELGVDERIAEVTPAMRVTALHQHGVYATLWQKSGKDARKILTEAKAFADQVQKHFGRFMDRPQNKIGSTGWEFIRGDINSALARTIASGSAEGLILGKMYGIKR